MSMLQWRRAMPTSSGGRKGREVFLADSSILQIPPFADSSLCGFLLLRTHPPPAGTLPLAAGTPPQATGTPPLAAGTHPLAALASGTPPMAAGTRLDHSQRNCSAAPSRALVHSLVMRSLLAFPVHLSWGSITTRCYQCRDSPDWQRWG